MTRLAELLRLIGKFSCYQSERIDPYLHRHYLKGQKNSPDEKRSKGESDKVLRNIEFILFYYF